MSSEQPTSAEGTFTKPSLTEGWEDRYRAMERAGRSQREIAEAFGVSTRTVIRWRGRLGLTKATPIPAYSQSEHDRARILLDDGCSFKETARSLGIATRTLRRWFPDRQPWTREQAGTFAVQSRILNTISTTHHLRDSAERTAA